MKYSIQYSRYAQSDLEEIWNYIVNELKNPQAAQSTIDGILDQVDIVAEFPDSGTELVFEQGMKSGYRYLIYKNYLAFYHIQESCIFVDRVIYGKRDYMHLLFPNL